MTFTRKNRKIRLQANLVLMFLFGMLLSGCKPDLNAVSITSPSYIAADESTDHIFAAKIADEGKSVEKSFQLVSDVSYEWFDFENKVLFAYGPGGLIEVNAPANEISQITKKNVSNVFQNKDSYGYVINNGTNSILIPDKNEAAEVELSFLVSQIQYGDGSIWISNIPNGSSQYNESCLFQYSTVGKQISFTKLERTYGFQILNGKMYFIKLDGIYDQTGKLLDCKTQSETDTILYYNNQVHDLYLSMQNSSLILDGAAVEEGVQWYDQISDSSIVYRKDNGFYILDFETGTSKIISSKSSESLSGFYEIFPLVSNR
jgi:hypothetical protein